MSGLDWIVLVVYLAAVGAVGLRFSRRQGKPGEFFLAGRSMRWLPIGLSVMATSFSAVNYTAFSSEVFKNGLYVTLSLPVFVLVAWPVTRVFMPFYHSMGLTSAYEYLERRFNRKVRQMASGLFICWCIAWMALALYVPARVLSSLTGVSLLWLVVLSGGVATLYTIAGGMRAVMWTDVMQFGVLLAGLVAGILVGAQQSGGFGAMLRLGVSGGLAKPFHPFDPRILSPDPGVRISLWSAFIGTFVVFLARYGADQAVVQRYFTARSLRDARRGFHLNYVAAVSTLLLLALLGFAIRAQSARAGTLGLAGLKPEDHFAAFVRSLPHGISGLIIAGLFAATMSSVDSGMNSCSAAFVTDFAGWRGRAAGAGRVLTALFGVVAMSLAMHIGRLGTVFEVANRVINGLGSPLLGVMLVGMFSRRANAPGMLVGGVLGIACSIASVVFIRGLSLHYYAVVNLLATGGACMGASLLAARLGARSSAQQLGWTWWERRKTSGK